MRAAIRIRDVRANEFDTLEVTPLRIDRVLDHLVGDDHRRRIRERSAIGTDFVLGFRVPRTIREVDDVSVHIDIRTLVPHLQRDADRIEVVEVDAVSAARTGNPVLHRVGIVVVRTIQIRGRNGVNRSVRVCPVRRDEVVTELTGMAYPTTLNRVIRRPYSRLDNTTRILNGRRAPTTASIKLWVRPNTTHVEWWLRGVRFDDRRERQQHTGNQHYC